MRREQRTGAEPGGGKEKFGSARKRLVRHSRTHTHAHARTRTRMHTAPYIACYRERTAFADAENAGEGKPTGDVPNICPIRDKCVTKGWIPST
jgi:hypothetical protein